MATTLTDNELTEIEALSVAEFSHRGYIIGPRLVATVKARDLRIRELEGLLDVARDQLT